MIYFFKPKVDAVGYAGVSLVSTCYALTMSINLEKSEGYCAVDAIGD
jgi:hypothetical protein